MPGPGRDQRKPIERLVRIVACLHAADDRGVDGERLIRVAEFEGPGAPDQLSRELRQLKAAGWQIDNVNEPGTPARYRLRSIDNRLRLSLTPEQLRALRQAALLAKRSDLAERLGLPADSSTHQDRAEVLLSGHDAALTQVLRAVRERRRLLFRYNATTREVHPYALRRTNNDWYLEGREHDVERVKKFLVSRMSHPDVLAAGAEDPPAQAERVGLHPMTWLVDDPVDVVVVCSPDFRDDVVRLLNAPESEETSGAETRLAYRVTHRAALRTRLLELGPRVLRVEGFDDHLVQLREVVSGGAR